MDTTLEPAQIRTPQTRQLSPFESTLMGVRKSLITIYGEETRADALIVETVNCARKVPALTRCTPVSIAAAVIRLAALDLDPAIPAEAYLVPYGQECTLIFGYGGLRKLCLRSGEVVDVFAECVRQNDVFRQAETPIVLPYHQLPPPQPNGMFTPRGRAVGYYAAALLRSGNWRVVVMSKAEVEGHRQRYSQAAQSQFWADTRPDLEGLTNFDKMAMKTCLRELCNPRKLTLSSDIARALADEEAILRQPAAASQGYTPQAMERPARAMPEDRHEDGSILSELVGDLAGDHGAMEDHLQAERKAKVVSPPRPARGKEVQAAKAPAPLEGAEGETPPLFSPEDSARLDAELAGQEH